MLATTGSGIGRSSDSPQQVSWLIRLAARLGLVDEGGGGSGRVRGVCAVAAVPDGNQPPVCSCPETRRGGLGACAEGER